MFTTVPEEARLLWHLSSRKTMDDYAQWVKEDKVGSANDVRRFWKSLLNDEVYDELKRKKDIAEVISLLPSDSNK